LYRELIFGIILAIRFVFVVFGIAIANNNRPAIPKTERRKNSGSSQSLASLLRLTEPTNQNQLT
jgi:hypothetical protein